MTRRTLMLPLLAFALSCGTDPDSQTSTLSGVAQHYGQAGALAGASLSLLGQPGATTTADANGNFSFDQLTPGDDVRVVVTATDYEETVNVSTRLSAGTTSVTAYGASVGFVGNQYTIVGLTRTAGAATIIAELEDDGGNPRTGIPLADITLVDQSQNPAAATGPYVFGASDQLDNMLFITTAFGGRSRIAFLNVPPGSYTLRVLVGANLVTRPVVARTDGVTLVVR